MVSIKSKKNTLLNHFVWLEEKTLKFVRQRTYGKIVDSPLIVDLQRSHGIILKSCAIETRSDGMRQLCQDK